MIHEACPKPAGIRLLFYGGDMMLGRAVNLTLPFQTKNEENITDSMPAGYYLQTAMHESPSLPELKRKLGQVRSANANGDYIFSNLLKVQLSTPPDVRFLNLETSVTDTIDNRDVPSKGINYHMNARNLSLVFSQFAKCNHFSEDKRFKSPFIVSFSNNHSLDFGRIALQKETLPAFEELKALPEFAGMVGCGANRKDAAKPIVVTVTKQGQQIHIYTVAVSSGCSGVPRDWIAGATSGGLVVLPELYSAANVEEAFQTCSAVLYEIYRAKRQFGNVVVVLSIHFGGNWAYRYGGNRPYMEVAEVQQLNDDGQRFRRQLCHRLIDELGVDVVYGHSSHHIRGLEVYNNKLIMFGCGDIINDYEGFENPGDCCYSRHGGIFNVDLNLNGDLRALHVLPTFMNELQLQLLTMGDNLIYDALAHRMQSKAAQVEELMQHINKLSVIDSTIGEEAADQHGTPVELRVDEKDMDGLLVYTP